MLFVLGPQRDSGPSFHPLHLLFRSQKVQHSRQTHIHQWCYLWLGSLQNSSARFYDLGFGCSSYMPGKRETKGFFVQYSAIFHILCDWSLLISAIGHVFSLPTPGTELESSSQRPIRLMILLIQMPPPGMIVWTVTAAMDSQEWLSTVLDLPFTLAAERPFVLVRGRLLCFLLHLKSTPLLFSLWACLVKGGSEEGKKWRSGNSSLWILRIGCKFSGVWMLLGSVVWKMLYFFRYLVMWKWKWKSWPQSWPQNNIKIKIN